MWAKPCRMWAINMGKVDAKAIEPTYHGSAFATVISCTIVNCTTRGCHHIARASGHENWRGRFICVMVPSGAAWGMWALATGQETRAASTHSHKRSGNANHTMCWWTRWPIRLKSPDSK